MTGKSHFPLYAILELVLLFVILPLLYLLDLIPFHKIIPLLVLFLYCGTILIINKRINSTRFKLNANWKFILLRFIIVSALIILSIKLFSTNQLLADFGTNRKLLYMILMYPLMSAFPQELIFREFFFYRYEPIFKNQTVLLISNILLFAFAHIYFANWIVIIFTLVGGTIFALTFLKTRSLLVVTIEHTIYGLVILSSGLSAHFYKAF